KLVADLIVQAALVAFHREDVVAAPCDDVSGNVPLGAHGIEGDHRAGKVEHAQQLGNSRDLVGFVTHEGLRERDSTLAGPGTHHMDVGKPTAAAAPESLAVDGDLSGDFPNAEQVQMDGDALGEGGRL